MILIWENLGRMNSTVDGYTYGLVEKLLFTQ